MIKLGFAHIFSNDQKTDPMINVLKGTRFQLTEYFLIIGRILVFKITM